MSLGVALGMRSEDEIKAVVEALYKEVDCTRKYTARAASRARRASTREGKERQLEDAECAYSWQRWYSGYVVALEWVLGRTSEPPVDVQET